MCEGLRKRSTLGRKVTSSNTLEEGSRGYRFPELIATTTSGASLCGRHRRSGAKILRITARRTYNAPLRRQQLADAAIALLGTEGARGLSHPRVDRHAGMPAGTSSYYFRTRKSLLQAAAERMTELDVADLSMMSELAHDETTGYSGTRGLAGLVMLSRNEPWLTRTRARYELLLAAHRDPDLNNAMLQFGIRFYGLARDVVAQWHHDDPPDDPAAIDDQAMLVLTFVNGVMMSFVHGYPVVSDAEQLDVRIRAILRSVNAIDG